MIIRTGCTCLVVMLLQWMSGAGLQCSAADTVHGPNRLAVPQGRALLDLSEDVSIWEPGRPATRGVSLAARELSESRRNGDRPRSARALNQLACAFLRCGEYGIAQDCNHIALGVFAELHVEGTSPVAPADALGAELDQRAHERSLAYLHALLNAAELRRDKAAMACIFGCLGNLYQERGQFEESLRQHHQQLEANIILEDPKAVAMSFLDVGLVHSQLKQYGSAQACFSRALTLHKALDDAAGMARSLSGLGRIEWLENRHESAMTLELEALAMFEQIADARGQGASWLRLGNMYYSVGDFECSEAAIHNAILFMSQSGAKAGLKRARSALARLTSARTDASNRHLRMGMAIACDHGPRGVEPGDGSGASTTLLGDAEVISGEPPLEPVTRRGDLPPAR